MVYTVDEVSVQLCIPRPTVYRYLKEYSIPFSRRSGRIFVPEESVGKIRTVRELHDSGFGTEAVRDRLRQGESMDLSRITERLDRLTEALETSRTERGRSVEPSPHAYPDAHAVRLVLARQSILISAVSNLAEMVGDLMAANGLPRRPILGYPEVEQAGRPLPLPDRGGKTLAVPASGSSNAAASRMPARRPHTLPSSISHDKFGTLARRRRTVLASSLIATLALLTVLLRQIF